MSRRRLPIVTRERLPSSQSPFFVSRSSSPTVFGYNRLGPHTDGTIYVHGSVASRSLLESAGGPVDDDDDVGSGGWAGVLSLATTVTGVQPDASSAGYETPADVRARAEQMTVRSAATGESD